MPDPFSVISGVGNLVGGVLSYRASRKQAKAAKEYYAESAATMRQNRAISNELMARYRQQYMPLEDDIIDMARTEWNPDFGGVLRRTTGDFNRARDQTRDEARTTYARMGIDPSNPMYLRGINRTSVSEALALSTARNMAREAERNRAMGGKFDAMRGAYSMGAGIPGLATGVNTNVASGMGNLGSQFSQMAGSNAAATGYFMNQAFNIGRDMWNSRAPTGSGPAPASPTYQLSNGYSMSMPAYSGWTPGPAAWSPGQ